MIVCINYTCWCVCVHACISVPTFLYSRIGYGYVDAPLGYIGVHIHICARVCMFSLFSVVLPPPPVNIAQSTHTETANTLSVCSSLSEGTSCE